jgi:hypothetical protein
VKAKWGVMAERQRRPRRPPGWLPTVTLGVAAGLWVAAVALGLTRPPVAGVAGLGSDGAVALLVFLVFVGVGALIAARRPGNRIGWIFCAIGLLVLLGGFATQYAVTGVLVRRPSLPAGPALAWLAGWTSVLGVSGFFYLLLLFPDGHLPSRRWRPVAWLYGAALAAGIVAGWLQPGPLSSGFVGDLGPVPNPVGWPAAAPALQAVNGASRLVVTALLPAAAMALGLRLRRSRGVARQQLKWLAYAGGVLGAAIVAEGLLELLGRQQGALDQAVGAVLVLGGMLGIPVAAAVAILQHRLYDIDRLLNRTLVYGAVTAILGAGYAVVVLGLGELLGSDRSSLAVAGATLAVAAAFQPVRRRVQRAVDRRFNRRRYDAARTVAAFTVRLRDELALDALTGELLAVVDATMEPVAASLWLRPSNQRTPRR